MVLWTLPVTCQFCIPNMLKVCCRDAQIREHALELLTQFPAAELRACLSLEEWRCICDAALDPGEDWAADEKLDGATKDSGEQPPGILSGDGYANTNCWNLEPICVPLSICLCPVLVCDWSAPRRIDTQECSNYYR